MKKAIALVLLFVFLSAAVSTLAEPGTPYLNAHGYMFPFYNRTYGNGVEVSAFEVSVPFGNGQLLFRQEKGIAEERSVLNWLDSNQEWGKYHIYYRINGQVYCEEWDSSYNSEEYTLYLNQTGDYLIWVVPFTNSEMNDSYTVDHFDRWEKAPKWNAISDEKRCFMKTFISHPLTPADIGLGY